MEPAGGDSHPAILRVVLLITDLERGGTPIRIAGLARRLIRLGVDVHVGCLAKPGPISAELAHAGVPTFACDAGGPRNLAALWRLAKHLRRIQPDLIHATLTHANVAARFVGGHLRIPVVTSTATIEVERRWHLEVERLTAWLDLGHLVNSRVLADHVERFFDVPRRRIHIIPPALEPFPRRIECAVARERLGIPAHDFVIAWLGRFDPVKRVELIVRCVEGISDPPCCAVLIGDGPDRARIERLAADGPAADRIHFTGWLEDPSQALSAADVFVFPSRTEGMPNAVLQAMALGLPVIGCDIPGLRELSSGGARVHLVPCEDERDLICAIRRMRADDRWRESLGRSAQQWAGDNLDPDDAAEATLEVYLRVLEQNPALPRG